MDTNFIKKAVHNKAFVTKRSVALPELERKLVVDILSQTPFFKGQNITVKYHDNNYEYDSYIIDCDKNTYLTKISQDQENNLSEDYEYTKLLEGKLITPNPISFDTVNLGDDKFSVLTSDFIYGTTVKELPFEIFDKNIKTFANLISYLHELTESKDKDETPLFIKDLEDMANHSLWLPEEDFEIIKKSKLQQKTAEINRDVLNKLSSILVEPQLPCSLCHTNLTRNKVLFKKGMFQITGFQYGRVMDPSLDIAIMFGYLGLNKKKLQKKEFIEQYTSSHRGLDISPDTLKDQVESYKDMASLVILLRSINREFYNTFVNQDTTHKKLENSFAYAEVRDSIVKMMPQHKEFLDKIFLNYQ